ncbi:hypothetical protein GUJ93_ZPchr0012g20928 [Zizania palustris]|uniref:Uncharacterized protein n=1 Tax=Zizania palustris TaxID=103762 RepID=A0A8J6BX73_ZIZPA|nr:hypothetical protein GUJ93_ZPchr0012g20928 [Zizania palustris]
MDRARRPRRVPAFGEWNYYYGPGDDLSTAPTVYGGGPDLEACSDIWFRYSPESRKPVTKKARRADQKPAGGANKQRPRAAARSSSESVAATPAKVATARVVRPPIDADLYQVPPPDFLPGEPRRRRKAGKSLWMGLTLSCFGLSC